MKLPCERFIYNNGWIYHVRMQLQHDLEVCILWIVALEFSGGMRKQHPPWGSYRKTEANVDPEKRVKRVGRLRVACK